MWKKCVCNSRKVMLSFFFFFFYQSSCKIMLINTKMQGQSGQTTWHIDWKGLWWSRLPFWFHLSLDFVQQRALASWFLCNFITHSRSVTINKQRFLPIKQNFVKYLPSAGESRKIWSGSSSAVWPAGAAQKSSCHPCCLPIKVGQY